MPVRPTRWSSRARSSWKARWLRRPVSGSVTAICESRVSSWRRKRRRTKAKQPSSSEADAEGDGDRVRRALLVVAQAGAVLERVVQRGPRLQVDAVLELPEDRVDHLVVELHGQLRVVRVDGREQPPRRLVVAPVELEQPADRLARLHRGVEQQHLLQVLGQAALGRLVAAADRAGRLEAVAALERLGLGHPVAGIDVGGAQPGGGVGALGLGRGAALREDREAREEAEHREQARHAAPHDPLIFGPAHATTHRNETWRT